MSPSLRLHFLLPWTSSSSSQTVWENPLICTPYTFHYTPLFRSSWVCKALRRPSCCVDRSCCGKWAFRNRMRIFAWWVRTCWWPSCRLQKRIKRSDEEVWFLQVWFVDLWDRIFSFKAWIDLRARQKHCWRNVGPLIKEMLRLKERCASLCTKSEFLRVLVNGF